MPGVLPSGSGLSAGGMDSQSMSPAVPFTISELTGQKRVLVLTNRALPYQGFKFAGKMKVETTYYPGNPIASQQVIGSEEGSTTITGIFNDRFIAGDNAGPHPDVAITSYDDVSSIFGIISTIDDMRRQGQQLKVTWGQVTRVGIMTEFAPNWIRTVDVEWSMTFEWASQGEEAAPNAPAPASISDAKAAVQAAIDRVNTALNSLGVINPPTQTPPNPFQTPNQQLESLYNQAAALIAAPQEFVNAVNGYVQNAYSTVDNIAALSGQVANFYSSSIQVALKIAALFAYAIEQFAGVEDEIDSRPSVYFYNVDLPPPTPPGPVALPIASITPAQMMTAESSARQTRKAARDGRLTAAVQRAQFAASAQPSTMLSVFIAANNMDLRRVAVQFYGSPNNWRDLAAYNDLPDSGLVAGQLIFVPQTIPATAAQGIPDASSVASYPQQQTGA